MPQGDYYVNRRNSPPSSLNYFATNEGETNQINKMIQAIKIDDVSVDE